MIRLEHVSKVFSNGKKKTVALNDVSFCLGEKGIVFIVGKSGSGKSTLLNLMAGFEKPTRGRIFFDGRDISSYTEKGKDDYHLYDMGFVFQNYALLEELSVEENIALAFKEKASLHQEEISALLDKVLLSGYQKRKVKNLSGGEKQRVALARALTRHPKVIFFDEPTGNLDYRSSRQILSIMKEVSKDTLLVIVSHNLNEATAFGERILSLEEGRLVSDVSCQEENQDTHSVYLSNLDEMSDEEISLLNEKMEKEDRHVVKARRDLFQATESKEENIAQERERKPYRFVSVLKSFLKVLSQNRLRLFLVPVFLSIACALFSCIYSLASLKDADYVSEIVHGKKQDSFFVDYSMPKEDGTAFNSTIAPVSETFEKTISSLSLKGDFHKVYKYPFYNDPKIYKNNGNESTMVNFFPSVNCFEEFYSKECTGLLIADADFVKGILSLDELSFVCESETKRKDGVYITDYFADSMMFYDKSLQGYESLLGFRKDSGYCYCYINGIIHTGYQERTDEFKKEMEEKQAPNLFLEDRFSDIYNYLYHGLNYFYSFDEDFYEVFQSDFELKPSFFQLCEINLRIPELIKYPSFLYPRYFASLDALEDDELGISFETMGYYLQNYRQEDIAKAVHDINENGGVDLCLDRVSSANTDYETQTEVIHSARMKLKIVSTENRNNLTIFAVSRKNYMQYRMYDDFCFGYQFSDIDDAKMVMSALKGEPVFLSSGKYYVQSKVVSGMIRFSDMFSFLSYVSLALCVLILLYHCLSLVHSQYYSLSVFQALGYRKKELCLSFLLENFFFSLITSALFFAVYQFMYRMINTLLVKAIFAYSKGSVYLNIISFSLPFYLFGILIVFVSASLLSLFYLLVVLHRRSVHQLQNEE